MTEMKRIVVEHYPVESLPDDLKRNLESVVSVRLTIEAESDPAAQPADPSGETIDRPFPPCGFAP